MSIVDREHAGPVPGSPEDPFRLGWRYVTRELPDGTVDYGQVPLTLDDLLFPQEEDRAVHHPEHAEATNYLSSCLKQLTAGLPGARVLDDCRVDFAIPGVEPMGPDLAVFLDVPTDWSRATLRVGDVGARPILVVEVTSPETRPQDLGPKRDLYHRAGVACYAIVDLRYRKDVYQGAELVGFRHAPGGYKAIPLDDRGRLRVEPLGCWLTIREGRVACLDDAGEVMETGPALFESRQAAVARAEVESRRAETLRATTDAALEQAEALRGIAAAETRRADVLQETTGLLREMADLLKGQVASAEARAAEAEARARELEAAMAAMREEVRRLRGGAGPDPGTGPGG